MKPATKIRLTHVRVPLVEPFRISSGAVSEKDGLVVEVFAGGLVGVGEASPMSGGFYSSDTPEGCWLDLCEALVPAVLGREFDSIAALNQTLDAIAASNFAKAGLETAFWDLEAQRAGLPLHRMLGGQRSAVESGLAVGLFDTLEETLDAVARYLPDGYKRVKLKIQPGRDEDLLEAFRGRFGDYPLFVDANASYRLEHLPLFQRMDRFGMMMYEQPLLGPLLEDSAALQRAVRTPVCLDEGLDSTESLKRAWELASFRIANIKIQRVGGLHHAMEMYRACVARGIPVWMGTMPELGIGSAQALAMATLDGCLFPTDVEASARWFRDEITDPPIRVAGGIIELPQVPGLGYALDRHKLGRYQVAGRTFEA